MEVSAEEVIMVLAQMPIERELIICDIVASGIYRPSIHKFNFSKTTGYNLTTFWLCCVRVRKKILLHENCCHMY